MNRLLSAFLVLAVSSCGSPASEVTLPAGTEIKIRLEHHLDASSSYEATLAAPLFVHGRLLARAGAPVWCELTELEDGQARFAMTLRSVQVNGRKHLLEAEPLIVDAAGIGTGAVVRLPLAKPLELPPQPAE